MSRLVQGVAFATGAAITALALYSVARFAQRVWNAWYEPIYRDGG